MKKTFIKKTGLGVLSVLTLTLGLAVNSYAWGPERTTFTKEKPATYVTFNSITNNQVNGEGVGDERNFVRIKEAGSANNRVDKIKIEVGKKYEVYVYYHNNAASNYHLTAENTRISSYYSGIINSKESGKVGATISADNAKPTRVWSEAELQTDSEASVMLKYVDGSAKIHNDKDSGINGMAIASEDLFSNTGALIGYDKLDGKLPGCAEYSGYITYELEATQAVGYISKMASKDGENFYDVITNAAIGDVITYKVLGQNKGSENLTNVVANDMLAKGLEPVGKPVLYSALDPEGFELDTDFFGSRGMEVRSLGVGGKGWEIVYKAKITKDAIDGECGENKLVNAAYMSYTLQNHEDLGNMIANHAVVYVKLPCKDEPEVADKMPDTGASMGGLLMSMMMGIAATGGCVYIICGIKMMHGRGAVEEVQQNEMGKDN